MVYYIELLEIDMETRKESYRSLRVSAATIRTAKRKAASRTNGKNAFIEFLCIERV